MALVSLVDRDRQWFKSHVGLAAQQTERSVSFCAHAIRGQGPFVIDDASADPRFVDNPLVTGEPFIRFYAGAPLVSPDGFGLGTLCVLDRKPRSPSPEQVRMLERLGLVCLAALDMHRRQERLRASLREVDHRQSDQQLLTAAMVHDMRGPLTVILANASDYVEKDANSEVFLDILDAAQRLIRMCNNLLEVGLAERGKTELRAAPIALMKLIRGVTQSLSHAADQLGCRLVVEGPDELTVSAEPELIVRTLNNLVDNAMRYGEGGTVTLRVDAGDGEVVVSVRDEGSGLAEAAIPHLFEPYHRGAAGSGGRGFGIGLASCRLAVEAHGGRIGAENVSPRGCRFWFTLPLTVH